jgi:hypothetical protein
MTKSSEGTPTIGQRTPTIAYRIGQRSPPRTVWIGQRSGCTERPPYPPAGWKAGERALEAPAGLHRGAVDRSTIPVFD